MTAFRPQKRRTFRSLLVLATLAWLSGTTMPASSPAPSEPLGYATLAEAIAATVPASGLSQQAYIKASNAQNGDQLGYSVAIDGDTAVVGAFTEDSNAVGVNGNQADNSMAAAGAAFVFVRSGGFWSQQALR